MMDAGAKPSKYSIMSFLSRSPNSESSSENSKRQLSSGSSDLTNVPKRSRALDQVDEAIAPSNNATDNVFNDAPQWAVALFKSMESIDKKIDFLSSKTEVLLDFKVVMEAKVEELEDSLKSVSLALEVNMEEHQSFETRIKSIDSLVKHLEAEHT